MYDVEGLRTAAAEDLDKMRIPRGLGKQLKKKIRQWDGERIRTNKGKTLGMSLLIGACEE